MMRNPPVSEQERALNRVKLELGNRHVLILIHGLLLFEVGIVMFLTGAPDFAGQWFGPHARLALGAGAAIPGLVLIIGAWLSDESSRGYWMQVGGLLGVVLWHMTMCVLYAAYAVKTGVPLLGFDELNRPGSARLYVPLIYANIFSLAMVHLVTLLRLGRPPR